MKARPTHWCIQYKHFREPWTESPFRDTLAGALAVAAYMMQVAEPRRKLRLNNKKTGFTWPL